MKKPSPIAVTSTVVGVICIGYYFICGILRSFSLSGLWIWLVFGLVLFSGCAWSVFIEPKLIKTKMACQYKVIKAACLSLFSLFLLAFAVFEGFLIREWICGTAMHGTRPDAIIILGGAVEYDRPGSTLEKRIDTAYEYIRKDPSVPVIACGGLGEGDILTEAQCIKNELVQRGIPEEIIYTEDRSSSTAENFTLAAELLPSGTKSIVVITSGFHQFRSIYIGRTSLEAKGFIGVELIPVSAPCTSVQLPCYMVREFAAFIRWLF
ncbi:MAG: YdcF family protein [Ruminococcaceae bacterium]|nr:YdcF family protein [Oscillospiraceae bacterium]